MECSDWEAMGLRCCRLLAAGELPPANTRRFRVAPLRVRRAMKTGVTDLLKTDIAAPTSTSHRSCDAVVAVT